MSATDWYAIDATHDAGLTTWVSGAANHPEFPIQNLPLCCFSDQNGPRGGVAIGDWLLDLAALASCDDLGEADRSLVAIAAQPTLNAFFALDADRRKQCETYQRERTHVADKMVHDPHPAMGIMVAATA